MNCFFASIMDQIYNSGNMYESKSQNHWKFSIITFKSEWYCRENVLWQENCSWQVHTCVYFGKMPRKMGKTVDQSLMHTTIVGLSFT